MKKNLCILIMLCVIKVDIDAQSWKLTGNSGTHPTTNFVGTLDYTPLAFRTNNIERMRLKAGNLNILPPAKRRFVILSEPGLLTLGNTSGDNLNIDESHLQARYSDTVAADLYLNRLGGITYAGGIASSVGIDAQGTIYGVTANSGNGIGLYASSYNNYGVSGISFQDIGIYGQTFDSDSYAGYFDGDVFSSGNYVASDEKLKQNIQDFSSAINIINQLHPKHYTYKHDGKYRSMNLPQGEHYGLIAQEVGKVLPDLIKETKYEVMDHEAKLPDSKNSDTKIYSSVKTSDEINFKALNYTELIPIIIKAVQEQQQTIQNQNQLIEKQQQQIDELKNMILSNQSSVNSQQSTTISSASLAQNIPNPFSGSTTINYLLPQQFSSAKIIITDKNGNTLKQINLSDKGRGSVTVDASTLASGAYQYSLIIDGKLMSLKQMILTK